MKEIKIEFNLLNYYKANKGVKKVDKKIILKSIILKISSNFLLNFYLKIILTIIFLYNIILFKLKSYKLPS